MLAIYREPTSAELAANGTKRVNNQIRLPFTYNGLEINNAIYPVSQVGISQAIDAVSEPRVQTDGMEFYPARKIQTIVQIQGVVVASTLGALHDAIDALNYAFDPVIISSVYTPEAFDQPVSWVGPLTFDYPTDDTTNYPTGLIAMEYFGRSTQAPVGLASKFEGLTAPFRIVLACPDPRRYNQALESATKIGAGSLTVDNSLASYYSWPSFFLTMTGDGGAYSITRPAALGRAARTLTLNLAGYGSGEVLRVDMNHKKIIDTSTGAVVMSTYVSGEFFDFAPDLMFLTITGSNVTTSASWQKAYI